MGAILGLLTGGLPFGGAILVIIGFAVGGFWLVETERVSSLNGQLAELHCQIDGPTQSPPCTQNGFRAKLSRANANLVQAKANTATVEASLAKDDAAVAQWKEQAAAAGRQAAQAQAAAALSLAQARSLATKLAAQKPPDGSYADLVGLIRK